MNKFVRKVILYCIPVALILMLVNLSLPYYWANDDLRSKIEYLAKNEQDFNSIFIGSSQVECHIIPQLIDSIIGSDFKSYNFGASNMHLLESRYFIDHLLSDSRFDKVENIFLGTGLPHGIDDISVGTERGTYYVDAENLMLSWSYFKDFKLYPGQFKRHFQAFMQNMFCLGRLHNRASYHFSEIEYDSMKIVNAGFNDLSFQKDVLKNKAIFYRHKYLKDSNKGLKYMKGTDLRVRKKFEKPMTDRIYAWRETIYDIHNAIENSGRKCYLVFNNSRPYHLYYNFEGTRNLYIGEASKYPEFWEIDNRIDVAHLNKNGAVMYTKRLAEEFISQVNVDN